MKHHITRAVVLALASAVALSGCATMESGTDNITQKVGGVFGSSNGNTRSVTGGAILGCAGGAILGKLIGNGSDMLKGCAAGAVAGGALSYKVHQDELKKAQALAAETQATLHVTPTVTTRQVQAKDDNGQATTTKALDKLVLPFPASDVLSRAPNVDHILVKAAVLSDSSAEQTTIEVLGTPKETSWMDSEIHAALKPNSTVKVVDEAAATPSLIISPIPSAK
jgi:outer membrane lipoprotein SlyB